MRCGQAESRLLRRGHTGSWEAAAWVEGLGDALRYQDTTVWLLAPWFLASEAAGRQVHFMLWGIGITSEVIELLVTRRLGRWGTVAHNPSSPAMKLSEKARVGGKMEAN